MSPPSDSIPEEITESVAPRRTMLAAERTQLAWWRTAFGVLAVGLAIGKIVPQLTGEEVIWPYTVLGACFALFAVALTVQGTLRRGQVEVAVRTGRPVETSRTLQAFLTGAATLLAVATTLMIIFN